MGKSRVDPVLKPLLSGTKPNTIRTYFPLGAAIYAPGGYEETQALMAKLGVESEIFFTGERRAFDWKTGETRLISPPDSATLELLLVEYARYSAFWVTHFDSTIGFKVWNVGHQGINPEGPE